MLQMPMLRLLSWKRHELYSEHSRCVAQHPGTGASHYRDQPGYQSQVQDRACARGSAGLGSGGGSTGSGGATPGNRGRTAVSQRLLRAPAGRGGRALPGVLADNGAVLSVVAARRAATPQPVGAARAWRAVVAAGRPHRLRSAAQAHPAIPVKPVGHRPHPDLDQSEPSSPD